MTARHFPWRVAARSTGDDIDFRQREKVAFAMGVGKKRRKKSGQVDLRSVPAAAEGLAGSQLLSQLCFPDL